MKNSKLTHSLSPKYVKARIISETAGNVIGLIVCLVLLRLYFQFEWPSWSFWVLIVLIAITLISFIWAAVEPKLTYKKWRYELDENYLQLSFGVFVEKWVTIPVTKIQAVTTAQGPVMKKFQLRSVKVETVGTSYTVPGLDHSVALTLKAELSELAKLKEDDGS